MLEELKKYCCDHFERSFKDFADQYRNLYVTMEADIENLTEAIDRRRVQERKEGVDEERLPTYTKKIEKPKLIRDYEQIRDRIFELEKKKNPQDIEEKKKIDKKIERPFDSFRDFIRKEKLRAEGKQPDTKEIDPDQHSSDLDTSANGDNTINQLEEVPEYTKKDCDKWIKIKKSSLVQLNRNFKKAHQTISELDQLFSLSKQTLTRFPMRSTRILSSKIFPQGGYDSDARQEKSAPAYGQQLQNPKHTQPQRVLDTKREKDFRLRTKRASAPGVVKSVPNLQIGAGSFAATASFLSRDQQISSSRAFLKTNRAEGSLAEASKSTRERSQGSRWLPKAKNNA